MTGIVTTQTLPGLQTQRLSTESIRFNTATFYGYSGFFSNAAPFNNSTGIYLGVETGRLPILVTTGGSYTWNGGRQDISNFYFRANQGDGIYVLFN